MKRTEALLNYLSDHGSITSIEAFKYLGDTRLAATVKRLKNEGYIFEKESYHTKTRYADKVTYARYRLIGKK